MHLTKSTLLTALQSRQGWATAAELLADEGLPATESNKRILRAIAAECPGDIISGDLGYRHRSNATWEEIEHCANRLASQGNDMLRRAAKMKGVLFL